MNVLLFQTDGVTRNGVLLTELFTAWVVKNVLVEQISHCTVVSKNPIEHCTFYSCAIFKFHRGFSHARLQSA